jgi:hypothetical protein
MIITKKAASKSKKKYTFQLQMLNYLQTGGALLTNPLLATGTPLYKAGLCNHLGLSTLVQALGRYFIKNLQAGVAVHATSLRALNKKILKPNVRDVNQIFGWAVFSQRKQTITQLYQLSRNECSDDLQHWRLAFLNSMRILHKEAMMLEEYMRDCYDDTLLQLKNKGFLTLVSPQFFQFGKELMKFLANALTQKRIETEGNSALKLAKSELHTRLTTI